ncbi:hypothetical protein JZ751_025852, partial [Albula glossodonta]
MLTVSSHYQQVLADVKPQGEGNSEGDSVTQNHSIFVTEKEKALLYCQYETTYSAPDFFWYIQLENKSPQLLYDGYRQDNKEGFKARPDNSAKTFNLEIAAAGLSDSATYYCAMRPTLCESVPHLIPKLPPSVPKLLHEL